LSLKIILYRIYRKKGGKVQGSPWVNGEMAESLTG
jgi:hypothetical protein